MFDVDINYRNPVKNGRNGKKGSEMEDSGHSRMSVSQARSGRIASFSLFFSWLSNSSFSFLFAWVLFSRSKQRMGVLAPASSQLGSTGGAFLLSSWFFYSIYLCIY